MKASSRIFHIIQAEGKGQVHTRSPLTQTLKQSAEKHKNISNRSAALISSEREREREGEREGKRDKERERERERDKVRSVRASTAKRCKM